MKSTIALSKTEVRRRVGRRSFRASSWLTRTTVDVPTLKPQAKSL
jgi:hypothetical protein